MSLLAVTLATPAMAYVGPGAGLGVLGVILAVAAATVMALVGLVLWPIRAVAHRRRLRAAAAAGRDAEPGGARSAREQVSGPDAGEEEGGGSSR